MASSCSIPMTMSSSSAPATANCFSKATSALPGRRPGMAALSHFGKAYYTYQILLDLKVEPGFALRTEPHPRFYTDRTDTCPIAVPALIRSWWPMLFFVVFKAPAEGRSHVFRPGEPFAQILVIPEEAQFDWSKWGQRKRPNAKCRRAASTPAATGWSRARAGSRAPTRFSTASIASCCARQNRRKGAAGNEADPLK